MSVVFFFFQVRVAVDLEAPPIEASDPVLRDVFRGGMVKPGALDPRQVDVLVSFMAGRARPPPGAGVAGPGAGFKGPGAGVGVGPGSGMGGNAGRPGQQF